MNLRPALLPLLSLAVTACGADLDAEDYNAAADGMDGANVTSSVLAVVSEPASAAMTAEAAAMASSQRASTFFQPAGCVVATPSGATVAYTFTNCTGPYGLVRVNGTVNATFSNRTATGWTVRVTGEVTMNRAVHRPDATSVVSFTGSTRTAMVTVNGSGTGPRGVAYANAGGYTTTWDGNCLGVNGAVTVTANGQSLTVTASNWRRCRGECPQAGGSVSISAPGGSATIAYSGGATATATNARGRTATVALFCGS